MTELIGELDVPPIEREAEIATAIGKIDELSRGAVPDCVLFYYGVPTIGKTTILREIRKYARGKGLIMSSIDFDRSLLREERREDWYDGEEGRLHAIERLLQDFLETGGLALGDVRVDDLRPDQADLAAERLLKYARDVYNFKQNPFVLFFDTIEDSDPDTFI